MNTYNLLSALQRFLRQRNVDPEGLTLESMVLVMFDWFRFAPAGLSTIDPPPDVLVYRYGGWSEGCATGFKLSLLRRVTQPDAEGQPTDWYAGVTMLFEPSGFSGLAPLSTVSSDWPSSEAFLHAIESSPAYRASRSTKPMGVMLESGGLR
ncbi:MAG: hypothetical protein KIT73_01180 [Burkholderiales bacterium]|nr:hypothetical protein [Burkholderiales bacterium]